MRTKLENQGMRVKGGGFNKAVVNIFQIFPIPMIARLINIFWCLLDMLYLDIFPNIVCKFKSERYFLI